MEYNCRGGPLHGRLLLRRPEHGSKGVLLVDKQGGKAWLYDWDEESQTFACRQEKAVPLIEDESAPDNRWRAADEGEYDVIAMPGVL